MIDFVLPVKIDNQDRLLLLHQTLATLRKNTKNINNIVLVNDNSTCLDVSMFINMFNNLNVINNTEQMGVGYSKNLGISLLQTKENIGKYLYIFDGDTFFTENWDTRLIDLYEKYKDEFKIVAGGVHPYLKPRLKEGNDEITSHDAISGWSWFLTYDVIDKYGYFMDNSIGTGKSEDWEYCQRIRNDGFKVGCIRPQIIAHTGITNTEGEKINGYNECIELAKSISREAILL